MKTLIQVLQEEDGTITVSSDIYPIKVGQVLPPSHHPVLFRDLKNWRWEKAREQMVPAYRILPNRTILNIADTCPTSNEELQNISGIGPFILEKYGQDILAIVNHYLETVANPETGEI